MAKKKRDKKKEPQPTRKQIVAEIAAHIEMTLSNDMQLIGARLNEIEQRLQQIVRNGNAMIGFAGQLCDLTRQIKDSRPVIDIDMSPITSAIIRGFNLRGRKQR